MRLKDIVVNAKGGRRLYAASYTKVGEFAGQECWWSHIPGTHLGIHQFADGSVHLNNGVVVDLPIMPIVIDSIMIDGRIWRTGPLQVPPRLGFELQPGQLGGTPVKGGEPFGPGRYRLPSHLMPVANKTGDDTKRNAAFLEVWGGNPYEHGGGGIDTSGQGWDTDYAYALVAEAGWWNRCQLWAVDPKTGRPCRLGGMFPYNHDERLMPENWEERAWWVERTPWHTHQVRIIRHGDRLVYHCQRPLSMLRAWMLATEGSWGDFSEVHYGPLVATYPNEYIHPSLDRLDAWARRGAGHGGPARGLGWKMYADARWIDIMRRGWYQPAGILRMLTGDQLRQEKQRWVARSRQLLDYLKVVLKESGTIQSMDMGQWQPSFAGRVGMQSFEWPIFMLGVDALETALDTPRGEQLDLETGCESLYGDPAMRFPSQYGGGAVGPAHYAEEVVGQLRPVLVPEWGQNQGDVSHVLNGLGIAKKRGMFDAIPISLDLHVPHATRTARLDWCRQLQDKSFTGIYEGILEESMS